MSKATNDNGRPLLTLDRRQLLRLAGTATGTLFFAKALSGCQKPTGSPPTGPVGGGNVSSLKVGHMQVLSSNVVLARDDGGVYAMSAVCPHAGCLVEDTSGTITAGLYCPCHGSAFNGNGNVTHGPARSGLVHYKVTVDGDGNITVDGGTEVAADVRVPIS